MAKTKTEMIDICSAIHSIFHSAKRHWFPFKEELIPLNGIYLLYEKDERGHHADRIVRIGSHTGDNQLRSRLKQHFLLENKDRSIFRKNIGRAILNKDNDPFLKQWDYDLTTRKNKEKYTGQVDFAKQEEIEKQVSEYIQHSFSFVVFEVEEKELRLDLEAKLISTVSLCAECGPSGYWLGRFSPKRKIRESGLWLVQHLYQSPLVWNDVEYIQKALGQKGGPKVFEKKRAQKSDWDRWEPMPKEHVVLSCQYEFSSEEYEKLQYGFIPKQQEDKWFIYFEDNKLHCHRSWTGFCLYVVEFEVTEKSSKIVKVTVNRDRDQYTERDNNWDCQFVVYLINLLLLHKPTPYPEKDDIDPETSAVQQWSQVGRAMFEEDVNEQQL